LTHSTYLYDGVQHNGDGSLKSRTPHIKVWHWIRSWTSYIHRLSSKPLLINFTAVRHVTSCRLVDRNRLPGRNALLLTPTHSPTQKMIETQLSTHENNLDLDSSGAWGSQDVRCLWPITDKPQLKIYCADFPLWLVCAC